MSYDPKIIADYFLAKSVEDLVDINPLKLIKLVYIAHGWFIVFSKEPLITEQPQAWKYGPIITSLYDELKAYGNDTLTGFQFNNKLILSNNVELLLNVVWDKYGHLSATQLSALTHKDDTPWYNTRIKYPNYNNPVIPDEYMVEYYKSLLV